MQHKGLARSRPGFERKPRAEWLSVLARADAGELESVLSALPRLPDYRVLKAPEAGLIMVRARAGGTGMRFNVGEVTVSRCSVQTAQGFTGSGYVQGRDLRRAELVAVLDALLQQSGPSRDVLLPRVSALAEKQAEARAERAARAAPTRVEFFTLVRGHG